MANPSLLVQPSLAGSGASPAHTPVEDAAAVVTGAFLASLGLFLLNEAGAATGGTAGLALLASRLGDWPLPLTYALITLPFVALAVTGKGWAFTLRSAAAVALVALFSLVHPAAATLSHLTPAYGVLVGNLAVGVGILVLFRHGASLGGFNVIALLCQERRGWRAGSVQGCLDASVVLLSAVVVPLEIVVLSAAGAVLLNLVLAMNHRPGRYLGA